MCALFDSPEQRRAGSVQSALGSSHTLGTSIFKFIYLFILERKIIMSHFNQEIFCPICSRKIRIVKMGKDDKLCIECPDCLSEIKIEFSTKTKIDSIVVLQSADWDI